MTDDKKTPTSSADDIADQDLDQAQGGVRIDRDHRTAAGLSPIVDLSVGNTVTGHQIDADRLDDVGETPPISVGYTLKHTIKR